MDLEKGIVERVKVDTGGGGSQPAHEATADDMAVLAVRHERHAEACVLRLCAQMQRDPNKRLPK